MTSHSVSMWLSSAEATKRLGVKRETLYAYVSRGLIRSAPGVGRQRKFRRDDVERLAQQGRKTLRSGESALVIESAVSLIEGGVLRYRGLDVTELAGTRPFEAVASLLWDTPYDAAAWVTPPAWRAPLGRSAAVAPPTATPHDRLMLAISTVAALDDDERTADAEAVVRGGPAFLSALSASLGSPDGPTVGAAVARGLIDGPAANEAIRLVDVALTLVADNGLATPTLTVRLVASMGAGPYASVLAGCCAMHGTVPGSNSLGVEHMLRALASGEDDASPAAQAARGDQVPGFGHPLYPAGDPRATLLLDGLHAAYGRSPLMQVVERARHDAERADLAPPNADFALGALAVVAGLRHGASECIYTLGRVAGFLAHCAEEYSTSSHYRLSAIYVGPGPTDEDGPAG